MVERVIGQHRVLVDDEDAVLLMSHPWKVHRFGSGLFYAVIAGPTRYLHRLILNATPGVEVDHRNGDGLDNQRHNLRLAPHKLNLANQHKQRRPTSSRFKGVSWWKLRGCWYASIKVDGKSRGLGHYSDEEEAARAYDKAAREAWGEFARTNF